MRMETSRALYLRRFAFSLSSSLGNASVKSYSINPWFTSSHAMRVAFCVRGFSSIGGAPAMIWRARRAARTTYANWLSGALVCTVMSLLPSKRSQNLLHHFAAPQARAAQRRNDGLCFPSRAFHVVVHYTKIVKLFSQLYLTLGLRQPPRDFIVRVHSAAAQPSLQLLARGRKYKDCHRLRQLFLHRRGALDINLQDKVQSFAAGFIEPLLGRAIGMLAEDACILEKLAPGDHGVELLRRNEIITFSTGLSRPAWPGGT